VNKKLADDGTDFRLLTGTEVDILKEKLDFPDDLLAELDVVVASLHVAGSDEADNTKRLIRAAENPHVHMLGHLTGRLLLERNPYPVNQQAVIDACAATGTWIELNASPWRFDLDWRLWHYARSKRCEVRHQLRRAPFGSFQFPSPRSRHRPQGLADPGRRDQHIGSPCPDEGLGPEAGLNRPQTASLASQGNG